MTLLILSTFNPPPAIAGNNPCHAQTAIAYGPDTFYASLDWDLASCSYGWIYGDIDVHIEIERREIGEWDDALGSATGPLIVDQICKAEKHCQVLASVDHLPVDLANYTAWIEYRALGVAGGAGFAHMAWTTCGSYVVRYGCPIPLYPQEPGDVLPE